VSERSGHNGHAGLAPGRGWERGDRAQVAVVSFSHTIQHFYPAVLGIVYPFALADFHVTYAVLGVILGVAGVMGNLLQGLAGVVKRFPANVLLGGQSLGLAFAAALGAVAPGMGLFAAARVLGTLVSWPQHPVGSAHLTDRLPHRRGFVLAAHTTGGNLGSLIAPVIASAILALAGWRWAMASMCILTAAGALLTWSWVRPAPRRAVVREPASAATSRSLSLREALRRRQALAVLVAGTISAAGRGLGVLTTYIPAYLRNGLHEPALALGVVVTVVSVGAIAGPVIGGHLSDRMNRLLLLCILYAVGAVGLVAFVLIGPGVLALALVGLVTGAFVYSEQPIRQSLFADAMHGVPARAAFGAFFAISQSVGSLWITVIGFVITAVSFQAAFFVMAASLVVSGIVIVAFGRDGGSPRAAGAAGAAAG
jgi:MFS family permease